jgi:hypothetical protein
VGAAIKTPVGLIAANVNGAITYRVLEHSYQSCVIGKEHPVLGQTTNRCMGFIGENFQPHQKCRHGRADDRLHGDQVQAGDDRGVAVLPGRGRRERCRHRQLQRQASRTFLWLNPGPEGEDAYLKLRISVSAALPVRVHRVQAGAGQHGGGGTDSVRRQHHLPRHSAAAVAVRHHVVIGQTIYLDSPS